jgi:4-alpha-glucanotransferase
VSDAFEAGRRSSGVLVHPSSFAGPGIGDLGKGTLRFLDWLAEAGQQYWQILPLVPVDRGGSPYNGLSALAGNPLLLSPELLRDDGLLSEGDIEKGRSLPADRVDFPAVLAWKDELLVTAYRNFLGGSAKHLVEPFEEFRAANEDWLEDYTLFRAARDYHRSAPWSEWPKDLRDREPLGMERWKQLLFDEVDRYAFQQFLFDRQWSAVRQRASELGIRIIGDLPIFVAYDSADVWANRDIFKLDEQGDPIVVAGVPPDYFSKTGQRWGNPLYEWEVLKSRDYDWWVKRMRRTLALVDIVRIDHFRGFEASWEIPVAAETAVDGEWVKGPGTDFFNSLAEQLGALPLIAEDLGMITPEVEALRDELELPGMRVLQFGFDGDPKNTHLPDNYTKGSVAYTGTHDNDTTAGWWSGLGSEDRGRVKSWMKEQHPNTWDLIRVIFESSSELAIIPIQDLLNLGSDARLNTPGEPDDNWTWRLGPRGLSPALASRLLELTRATGRAEQNNAQG